MRSFLLAASLLLGSAGPAAADRAETHRRDDAVIASQRTLDRRGTLLFSIDRYHRRGNLQLVTSDRSIRIRSVDVTYLNGKTIRIAPARSTDSIELGNRRIASIEVHYVNRGGARNGRIAVVAAR